MRIRRSLRINRELNETYLQVEVWLRFYPVISPEQRSYITCACALVISIQREWYKKKTERRRREEGYNKGMWLLFVVAFVGGAGSMDCWCGIFIEHVRRKKTRLWKKTVKSQKTAAYLPSLVVYYKNKVMILKITLEKRQNSLTIL